MRPSFSRPDVAASLATRIDLGENGTGEGEQQLSFQDLGSPLSDVTFTIVDLETTGGKPGANAITEIGAVKVRGGQVLGEFSTLVNPEALIPPAITALTGITQGMVATAPRIGDVMPRFLRFLDGSVIVAHNARFDVGHLRAACRALDLSWPRVRVVDTLTLARKTITRSEVPNYKLGTLAAFCQANVAPTHRGLDDAYATVDVFRLILTRLQARGVSYLEDLLAAGSKVSAAQRSKAYLARNLPKAPGVYIFSSASGQPLYVGTSRNLAARVRSYFTASEGRRHIREMLNIATEVSTEVYPTLLDAGLAELRLITELDPPYNRRSRHRERHCWLVLTNEKYPRLQATSRPTQAQLPFALGPFYSRSSADRARELITDTTFLRTCTRTLTPDNQTCHRLELGLCAAPCLTPQRRKVVEAGGSPLPASPRESEEAARAALAGDMDAIVPPALRALERFTQEERFEAAAALRDRLRSYLHAAKRAERLRPLFLARCLIAARPAQGSWEVILVSAGALVRSQSVAQAEDVPVVADAFRAEWEEETSGSQASRAASSFDGEACELIASWVFSEGCRVLHYDGEVPLAFPRHGAYAAASRHPSLDSFTRERSDEAD